MRGYVYILENESMPGIYKVGRSKNGGRARAADLYTTGVPTQFSVVTEVLVRDCVDCEEQIHSLLDRYRVNPSREFFRCDLPEVVQAVFSISLGEWHMDAHHLDVVDLTALRWVEHHTGCDYADACSIIMEVTPSELKAAADRRVANVKAASEPLEKKAQSNVHPMHFGISESDISRDAS